MRATICENKDATMDLEDVVIQLVSGPTFQCLDETIDRRHGLRNEKRR